MIDEDGCGGDDKDNVNNNNKDDNDMYGDMDVKHDAFIDIFKPYLCCSIGIIFIIYVFLAFQAIALHNSTKYHQVKRFHKQYFTWHTVLHKSNLLPGIESSLV